MTHAEHESARLYAEADQIKQEYGSLAVQEVEIRGRMRVLEERLATIEHTQGTLNPGRADFAGSTGGGWGRL